MDEVSITFVSSKDLVKLSDMKNIAIFASGSGSNAEEIMKHFANNNSGRITLVVSNNPNAFVLERAKKYDIPTHVYNKEDIKNGKLLEHLRSFQIEFIVLAGYLKKVPDDIIEAYPKAIVNIHPALLPKFGGKGMYGMNVHRAVVEARETKSGMTIHYVDENYDEGDIIEQHECSVNPEDTPEDLQRKVLELEHNYFAPCIERIL